MITNCTTPIKPPTYGSVPPIQNASNHQPDMLRSCNRLTLTGSSRKNATSATANAANSRHPYADKTASKSSIPPSAIAHTIGIAAKHATANVGSPIASFAPNYVRRRARPRNDKNDGLQQSSFVSDIFLLLLFTVNVQSSCPALQVEHPLE